MSETVINDYGSVPTDDFTYQSTADRFFNFAGGILDTYAKAWGSVQIAKANAGAQRKLNDLERINATLGPNDPAAAQREANKTLAEKWLPVGTGGAMGGALWLVAGVAVALLVFLLIRRK